MENWVLLEYCWNIPQLKGNCEKYVLQTKKLNLFHFKVFLKRELWSLNKCESTSVDRMSGQDW